MIYIDNKVVEELKKIDKREDCGFIAGNNNIYTKIYKTKNIARDRDKFEIGFFDKFKIACKIIWERYNCWALYHVHINKRYPTFSDIRWRAIGEKIIILYKGKVHVFEVVGNDDEKDIREEIYCDIGSKDEKNKDNKTN